MKNYNYSGKSTLAFTHEKQDYLAYGAGPHDLPEDASIVRTLVAKGVLVETPVKETNSKTSKS
jgi:hypothetical protein